MQLSFVRLSALSIAASVGILLCASGADVTTPIPIEFCHVGDDALSQKLAAAIKAEFQRSPDFRLTGGGGARTLVVTIPRNVEWEKIGKRIRATYNVRFSSADGTEIGTEKGPCWESALPRCAAQIVVEAKVAARKVPQ
jgi:hypothetical protein